MINFGVDIIVMMRLFAFLILVDFILGVIAAGKENKLKSRTCSNGIFRSIGELFILTFFVIMNKLIPNVHDYLIMFIALFIVKELLSVCENLQRLDVWLPKFVVNFLPTLAEQIDNGKMPIKKNTKK